MLPLIPASQGQAGTGTALLGSASSPPCLWNRDGCHSPGATAGTVPPPNPGYGENGDPRGRIPVVPSTQSLLPHPGAQHGAKLPEIPSSSARGFHGSTFPHFPCSQSTFPHFPHSQSIFPPFPGGWKAQTESGISRMAPGWQQYREQRRDPKICG